MPEKESALMDKLVTMLFEFNDMKKEVQELRQKVEALETAQDIELLEEMEDEQAQEHFEERMRWEDIW